MTDSGTILKLDEITKRFDDIVANDHINLSVRRGEVHGLLGENGAGKSTLMKILYGLYSPTDGTIRFDGKEQSFSSPEDAIRAGIGMVHQHFMLIPRMTVLENIVLGEREPPEGVADVNGLAGSVLNMFTRGRETPRDRVESLANEYDLMVDPDAKVWELDIGERQRVEVLKALYRDVDLLILDEPTAVLTPTEAEQMFETIRQLVDEGLTVIFITHKLWEIGNMTDRVTVLRDGKKVETVETDSVTQGELAEMMVGREVLIRMEKDQVSTGDPVLAAENITATDERDIRTLSGANVTVREGEIVGIAGVSGNGQRELAECLFGFRDLERGTIEILGEDLTEESPQAFIDAGVSFIPEDRYEHGCAPELSVMHNSSVKEYRNGQFRGVGGLLDYGKMETYAENLVEEFDIRGVSSVTDTEAGDLSGGNLQKLILGREINKEPNLLIANQPTRGVDVGAIEHIRKLMLKQRASGNGVLLLSEDLDELLDVSDRILVIYEGEFVYETTPEETDKWELGMYMSTGEQPEEVNKQVIEGLQ